MVSFNLLGLDTNSSGTSSSNSGSRRRRSLSATFSSSDESSIWSPPDTPTPILNLPLKHKSRLQPGPVPVIQTQSGARLPKKLQQSPFSFSVPIVKRSRVSSSSFKTYRASSGDSGEDTETDFNHYEDEEQTETELGTILSDVESDLNPNPISEDGYSKGAGGDMIEIEREGDEIDMFLLEDKNIPSSPVSYGWSDRKGKKRSREYGYEESMDYDDQQDGDDEMETEGLLSVKQRGKRPIKHSKHISTYPNEKASALSNNFSVVGNICNKLGNLHASSTVIAMNIDVPLHPSSTSSYPQEKRSDLLSYRLATKEAGAGVHNSLPPQKVKSRKLVRKRGQQPTKRCFQQLTASEDPLVNLPAFKIWEGGKIKFNLTPSEKGSAMDISDIDEEDQYLVDQEMKSLSDIEIENELTAGGNSSDIDMKSISSFSSSTTKVSLYLTPQKTKKSRKHVHSTATATGKSQLFSVDQQQFIALKRTLQRRPRVNPFVERVPGQQSTSQLRRSSPSSLLPARKYMTRSHRPPIITHKNRAKPGRIEFGACVLGQTFISLLKAKLSARQRRRQKMTAHNIQTKDGDWRRMVGTWWGHEQVSKLTNRWWLQIKGPDEVEVEALLPPVIVSEDELMLSPPRSSPATATLNQARKRIVEEATDDLTLGTEVEERWARRNELRLQELQPYCLNQKLQLQARRTEQRRARAEVVRQRLAEIAEQRRLEDVQRRESIRLAEEERHRVEQLRMRQEQEEQDRLSRQAELVLAQAQAESIRQQNEEEQALNSIDASPVPSSPAQSESSTVISEPPEYEFPFYPVILSRSSNPRAFSNPMPRITRAIPIPSDILPDYLPDRYNNRSPPPPPPYNARTDCQTLIAPVFIEDSDEEDEDMDDGDDEVDLASPLVPSQARGRGRLASPEPRVIGSFPSRQLFAPTPIRAVASIDPIRAFENALDLEEGVDEANAVEGHLDDSDNDIDDMEEDVVPGGPVASVFQRVFGMVWGTSSRR